MVCFALVILYLLIVPLSLSFLAKTSQHAALLKMWAEAEEPAFEQSRGQMRPNRTLEIHYLGYTQDRVKQNTTPKVGFTDSTFYFKYKINEKTIEIKYSSSDAVSGETVFFISLAGGFKPDVLFK